MVDEQRMNESIKYIMDNIRKNKYPEGHPFLEEYFENSIGCIMLAMIKFYLIEDVLINDFIKKLRANVNGEFDSTKYYEALSEVAVFYYILTGIIQKNKLTNLCNIIHEPNLIYNNMKKLEYSFIFKNDELSLDMVNFEVKTIACDPFIREKDVNMYTSKVLVKPFFNDIIINKEELERKYGPIHILERSTHLRQVKKNIKKIVEKYEGEELHDYKKINIGVIVMQDATSIEEFYSYMLHPKKGIVNTIDFGNLDILVFFSLTSRPELFMNDIYEGGHIFSIYCNENKNTFKYGELLRLDNVMCIDNEVCEEFFELAKKEYGKYRVVCRDGFLFIIPYQTSKSEENEFLNYLSGKNQNYYKEK